MVELPWQRGGYQVRFLIGPQLNNCYREYVPATNDRKVVLSPVFFIQKSETTMPGARNNRSDKQRLDDIRKAATNIVATVNDMEPEMPNAKTSKAMSLGEQVEKVNEAIYKLAYGYGWGMVTDAPVRQIEMYCVAVYPDYAIIEKDGLYYRVNYTIADNKAEIAPEDTWQKVEKEWVAAKSGWASQHTFTPSKNNALKAIAKTDDELRVGNYLAMFDGRDLEGLASKRINKDGSIGEYFTKATQFESPYTDVGVLYMDWEHGIGSDGISDDDVLGYVDWKSARVDEKGLFVERVLNRRNRYVQWIEELIDAGAIGTSSEAISGGVVKGNDGEIKAWPLRRDSLTVTPMDWRMASDNTLAAIKALSQEFPALKAIIEPEKLTNGTVKTVQITDSEPEPEATEPETGAQPVAQGAADGDEERSNKTAERLSMELDLLLLED